MDVRRAKSRSRLSRRPARGFGPKRPEAADLSQESPLQIKDGDLFVQTMEPNTMKVAPGGVFKMRFVVSNGALCVNNDDPACCGPGCQYEDSSICSPYNGYLYNLSVTPEWTDAAETGVRCIETTEWGTGDHPKGPADGFSWQAPQSPGTYEVTVDFVASSGDIQPSAASDAQASVTFQIEVADGAPLNEDFGCTSDAECPIDGYACSDANTCEIETTGDNDPTDIIASVVNNLPAILALFLAIQVLSTLG